MVFSDTGSFFLALVLAVCAIIPIIFYFRGEASGKKSTRGIAVEGDSLDSGVVYSRLSEPVQAPNSQRVLVFLQAPDGEVFAARVPFRDIPEHFVVYFDEKGDMQAASAQKPSK